MLWPDSDASHLEGKLVAHYHAGPLGATTAFGPRTPAASLPSEHSAAYATPHSAPVVRGVKITRPLKIVVSICRASIT